MAYSLFGGIFNPNNNQMSDEELFNKIDVMENKIDKLQTQYSNIEEKYNKLVDFFNIKDTYEYLFDGLSMMTNSQLKSRTTKNELNTMISIPNNKEKFCKAFMLTKLRRFIDESNRGEKMESVEEFINYIINHTDIIDSVKQYFQDNLSLVKIDIQNFMINHKNFFNTTE